MGLKSKSHTLCDQSSKMLTLCDRDYPPPFCNSSRCTNQKPPPGSLLCKLHNGVLNKRQGPLSGAFCLLCRDVKCWNVWKMLAHVVAGFVDEVPVFIAMSTPRGHPAQEVPEQGRVFLVLSNAIPHDVGIGHFAAVIRPGGGGVQRARALLAIGLAPVPNQQGRENSGGVLRHVIQPPPSGR